MRLKFDVDDPNSYRCCFCCHVRVGTIMLGIFNMFVLLMVLAMSALAVLHPELVPKYRLPLTEDAANASLENANEGWPEREFSTQNDEDRFIGFLLVVGYFVITTMLIYGSAKGRAGYLMPFFCMQVIDFCLTCLSGVSYFSYIPNIKRWIQGLVDFPWKEELLQMDADWLMLLVVTIFVLIITVKAYLIGVVWACYKYLTNYQATIARGVIRTYNAETGNPEDSEMLLPPKYEDVLQMAAEEPAPPPYSPNREE